MKAGRAVTFHGAFASKGDAVRKEHRVSGGYIRPTTIQGHRRFLVLSRRTQGNPLTRGETSKILRRVRKVQRLPGPYNAGFADGQRNIAREYGPPAKTGRYAGIKRNPRQHRPRVTIRRHTGRTFTLGKQSPWKERVHRVNPVRGHTGSDMSWLWLGLIAGGLWLLSRQPAEAAGPLPGVDWAPGASGLETATMTLDGSGPGVIQV